MCTISTLTCNMLATTPLGFGRMLMPWHAVSVQSVQRTAFKPEMLAPASLQLVAPNFKRQPNRVAGTDGRAASASVQFQPKGLPTRTTAQMLGAFTNRALSPNKLCFSVSPMGLLGSVAHLSYSQEGFCSANEHLLLDACQQPPASAICCCLGRDRGCFDNATGASASVHQGHHA